LVDGGSEPATRVLPEGHARVAGWCHAVRGLQQIVDVCADECGGKEANERERREPSTDVRRVQERTAEAAVVRERLERRARIRDGDEPMAVVLRPLEEVRELRQRLDRAARLARNDEERPREVER